MEVIGKGDTYCPRCNFLEFSFQQSCFFATRQPETRGLRRLNVAPPSVSTVGFWGIIWGHNHQMDVHDARYRSFHSVAGGGGFRFNNWFLIKVAMGVWRKMGLWYFLHPKGSTCLSFDVYGTEAWQRKHLTAVPFATILNLAKNQKNLKLSQILLIPTSLLQAFPEVLRCLT